MTFLKVNAHLLHSTTWREPLLWRLMETTALLAVPDVFEVPRPQLDVRTAQRTGWEVPPGRYGFAAVSGPGIIGAAIVGVEEGLAGLHRLGEPEPESRDQGFDGRRVVRINGGFVVLNYAKFRDWDSSAERVAKWRAKRAAELMAAAAPKKAKTNGHDTWATPMLKAWTRGVLPVQQSLRTLAALKKAIPDDALCLQLITWFAEHPDNRGRFGLEHLLKHWSAQLLEMERGPRGSSVLDAGREALRQLERDA